MWAQAILVSAAAAMGWWLVDSVPDTRALAEARARVSAESMATYRDAALSFAQAHPGFEGELPNPLPTLPAWWAGAQGLTACVEGPLVVVYLTGNEARDVWPQMRRLSAGSMLVGVAHQASGRLYSPDHGDTGIALPASIPDGAPVWLATRN